MVHRVSMTLHLDLGGICNPWSNPRTTQRKAKKEKPQNQRPNEIKTKAGMERNRRGKKKTASVGPFTVAAFNEVSLNSGMVACLVPVSIAPPPPLFPIVFVPSYPRNPSTRKSFIRSLNYPCRVLQLQTQSGHRRGVGIGHLEGAPTPTPP